MGRKSSTTVRDEHDAKLPGIVTTTNPAVIDPNSAVKEPRKARRFTATIYLENSDVKHQYVLVKVGKELTGIFSYTPETGILDDIGASKMMFAAGQNILRTERKSLIKLAEYRLETDEVSKHPFQAASFGAVLTASATQFVAKAPPVNAANS